MSDLFNALFSDGGLKVDATETPQENGIMFRPRYSKGPNKKYEAIIRFLPNPENPRKKSIISKWVVYLKDPRTNQGRDIDSPSTVNEPDPMTSMFFNLRNNTSNPNAVKLSEDFKRHQRFYSLVQIIENPCEPQTVGKIMVWCYGQTIADKINVEATPVMQGVEPNKPFDLFEGRLFKVVAVEKGGFNNLDQSLFVDAKYPINCMRIPQVVNGATSFVPATRELASTPEGQAAIGNFLTNSSPSLTQYEFKPWDQNTKDYVNEMIVLHQQMVNGQVGMGAAQHNAIVNQMSNNQSAIPVQPNVTMGGMMGTTSMMGGMPSAPAPAPNSLGNILNQPTPNATGAVMETNPIINSAPMGTPENVTSGISMGLDAPSMLGGMGNVGTVPTGSINGLDVNNLDSIMGSTPQAVTPAPNLSMGGNLNDLLGDVMA